MISKIGDSTRRS